MNGLHGLDAPRVWDTALAFERLNASNQAGSKRTAERRLHELLALPAALGVDSLLDELGRAPNRVVLDWVVDQARRQRQLVVLVQLAALPTGQACVFANDLRGGRYWVPLLPGDDGMAVAVLQALQQLQAHVGKPVTLLGHGEVVGLLRDVDAPPGLNLPWHAYLPVLTVAASSRCRTALTPHLQRLEAESLHIIREAVAEAQRPVMLYSVGKDSSVMLHLARKAFAPGVPPFPLLHVDTRWKFQEMYLFRDHMAQHSGMDLQVHINPDAVARNINPFDHGSALHTDITKTEGLKQALDQHGFDVVFGGARRDEEKSRAKERIFSFRTASHQWDPRQQRPELWNLYNTRKGPGESMRVFPLSNWTELDVWQYIHHEQIPVVPLYFSKPRPVVNRNGMLLMVDDSRFRLLPDEHIMLKPVRFRTLGCYPLTGAIESQARSVEDIILELINARQSERQGRAIDSDAAASMEKKKQEGYF